MARITIEDCLNRIPNRFELTLAASNRARMLSTGGQPLLDPARDKPTVIALREIAAGKVGTEMLNKQTANKVSLAEAFSGDTLFTAPIAPMGSVASETVTEPMEPVEPIALVEQAEAVPEAVAEAAPKAEPEADESTP